MRLCGIQIHSRREHCHIAKLGLHHNALLPAIKGTREDNSPSPMLPQKLIGIGAVVLGWRDSGWWAGDWGIVPADVLWHLQKIIQNNSELRQGVAQGSEWGVWRIRGMSFCVGRIFCFRVVCRPSNFYSSGPLLVLLSLWIASIRFHQFICIALLDHETLDLQCLGDTLFPIWNRNVFRIHLAKRLFLTDRQLR